MKIDPAEYVVLRREDITSVTQDWLEEHRLPMMTIPEFQKDMVMNTFRWFPDTVKNGQIDLHMLIYGICGEAGEVAEEMKKFLRGSRTEQQLTERLAIESVDCFHYIVLLWYVLGIDPGEVYQRITRDNEKRFGPQAS
jgi:NTP pyrophosphatase (non-canonical NTP hydrolase)